MKKINLLAVILVPFFCFSQEKQSIYDILDGNVYETNLIYIDEESKEVIHTEPFGAIEFQTDNGNLIIAKQTQDYSSSYEEYFQQENVFEIRDNSLLLKGDMFGPIDGIQLKLTESPIPSEYHLTAEITNSNKKITIILQLRKSFFYLNKEFSKQDLGGIWQLNELSERGETITMEDLKNMENENLKDKYLDKDNSLKINGNGTFAGFGKEGNWTLSKSGYFLVLEENNAQEKSSNTDETEFGYNRDKIKTLKISRISSKQLSIVTSSYMSNTTLKYVKK